MSAVHFLSAGWVMTRPDVPLYNAVLGPVDRERVSECVCVGAVMGQQLASLVACTSGDSDPNRVNNFLLVCLDPPPCVLLERVAGWFLNCIY